MRSADSQSFHRDRRRRLRGAEVVPNLKRGVHADGAEVDDVARKVSIHDTAVSRVAVSELTIIIQTPASDLVATDVAVRGAQHGALERVARPAAGGERKGFAPAEVDGRVVFLQRPVCGIPPAGPFKSARVRDGSAARPTPANDVTDVQDRAPPGLHPVNLHGFSAREIDGIRDSAGLERFIS